MQTSRAQPPVSTHVLMQLDDGSKLVGGCPAAAIAVAFQLWLHAHTLLWGVSLHRGQAIISSSSPLRYTLSHSFPTLLRRLRAAPSFPLTSRSSSCAPRATPSPGTCMARVPSSRPLLETPPTLSQSFFPPFPFHPLFSGTSTLLFPPACLPPLSPPTLLRHVAFMSQFPHLRPSDAKKQDEVQVCGGGGQRMSEGVGGEEGGRAREVGRGAGREVPGTGLWMGGRGVDGGARCGSWYGRVV